MEISPSKKNSITLIADAVSTGFGSRNGTDLKAICKDEGIIILEDNYEDYFDGMLVWNGRGFYIHLNIAKGNTLESALGRYTLAHELGHYFIDAHREGLRSGQIPPHRSYASLMHDESMEREADYFASCLLMPENRLREVSARKKFSLDIIRQIADRFSVSLTAASLRFMHVGTHEIMIVFSQHGIVRWSFRSKDFPKLANKFKVGEPVPPSTVAGEAFSKSDARYTSIEELDLEDWFIYNSWDPGRQLYEQCFYSEENNYVVSIIWFK